MAKEYKSRLIVNADDFAYSYGISRGIVDAYKNGVVTSTTFMANMPSAEASAKLALENPGLGVGVHFVLTAGRPILSDVKSLTKEDGSFMRPNALAEADIDTGEVEREYRAQLERFISLGLMPTHFDSHHHTHMDKRIYPVIEMLSLEYNVPVRIPTGFSVGRARGVDNFIDGFFGEGATTENLIKLINDSIGFGTSELMCHPGYQNDAIRDIDSYREMREKELAILTSAEVKQVIAGLNIELINYTMI